MSEATEVKAAVSEKVRKAMDLIATFTLKEAADLVKLMKDELGVEAAAPMAMAMPVAGGPAAAAEVEEVTEFDVILKSFGTPETKIAVVKEVRKITGLGLKEAKDAVEGAPQPILQKTDKKKAEETKKALEAVGAQVEIKPAA